MAEMKGLLGAAIKLIAGRVGQCFAIWHHYREPEESSSGSYNVHYVVQMSSQMVELESSVGIPSS
jgi:hypothetical protein